MNEQREKLKEAALRNWILEVPSSKLKDRLMRGSLHSRDAFFAGYEAARNEWVPVSEGLPIDGTYLVTTDFPLGNPVTETTPRFRLVKRAAWFNHGWWDPAVTAPLMHPVYAWRELPQPYQEDR